MITQALRGSRRHFTLALPGGGVFSRIKGRGIPAKAPERASHSCAESILKEKNTEPHENMDFRNLFCDKICLIRNFVVNLWCQIKQVTTMRKRKEKIELTEKEEELIRAIRNYQKSFPNGYPQLLYYIQHLVDELTDHL